MDHLKIRLSPRGGGEMPGGGSADFNRGRTFNDLCELVREGGNLTLCVRTSMGFTHDHGPTMMCDWSGRLLTHLL